MQFLTFKNAISPDGEPCNGFGSSHATFGSGYNLISDFSCYEVAIF